MKRYNLSSADEESLAQSLIDANILIDGFPAEGVTLDIIGVIHKPSGKKDKEGFDIYKSIEGYHANLIADLTEEQESMLPIIDPPKNPYRLFAGE